ncbi:complement factor H isoform X2 [Cottoperca gobio]|uniref:Complement factor H isoform X2 n=1 Tax=Cottoperca gobio TaxID=56716 RepID=A0A6J2PIT8_COTGO|nr:complement factor H-like isoform X2 [Cottoperca gobio]
MHVLTQSCVLFVWMHTLTFVKSQDCTRKQFVDGPLFDDSFDTSDLEASYSAGKQVRVSCRVGFSGFFKLTCTEGQWLSRGTKCQLRSCGHPGEAQSADFRLEKGEDFVFGSQVVYTCHKGYQMVSRTNFRRCMTEGWDGTVPVCEAKQCPVIHFDSKVLVNGDTDEATYGNVVRFSCKSNSEMLDGSAEIYCDENGEWIGKVPTCKAITCAVPAIENGYVTEDIQEYKEREVLHFECDPKYRRGEDRPSQCTKLGVQAEWSPTPVCEPITCKLQLPPLEGTRYEPAFRNVFLPGDLLTVNCGEKYWISNPQNISAVTTCKDNGEWTIRPICKEVICSNQRDRHVYSWNVYWRQIITLGETTPYRCTTGYMESATEATCTRDGWKPNPLCQEITCDRRDFETADVVRNNKQKYRYNDQVDYVCKEGYRGRFTLNCKDRGWTGNSQCSEIKCIRQVYQNADIDENVRNEYRYNDQVKYTCNNGHEGHFTLTCGETGWNGSPQCKLIQCKTLQIDNAYITHNEKESYGHNDRVQYACRKGSDRRFTVTCEQSGWTGIESCSACQNAAVPHGFVVGPYNDTVYYTCKHGYKLFTKGWWSEAKCIDGEWSGVQICIENEKCGETPVIPNGEVTPPRGQIKTARITCREGYNVNVNRLTCSNGTWHSQGVPTKEICTPFAVPCKAPPQVQNAVVLTSYQKKYLSDTEVTYKCRDKYTLLLGENTIRCKDGKWEAKNIECTQLPQEQ